MESAFGTLVVFNDDCLEQDNLQIALLLLNKCLFIFLISGNIRVEENMLQPKASVGIWGTGNLLVACIQESYFLVIETVINRK